MEAGLPTIIIKGPEYDNYQTVGSPTISSKNASGFSTSNYLILPERFNPGSNPWEICLRFSFTSNTEWDTIIGCDTDFAHGLHICLINNKVKLEATSNNSSWNICAVQGTTTLSTDTFYYFKVVFTGTQYVGYLSTDGETWNTEFTVNSSLTISVTKTQFLGAQTFFESTHYLHGTLDLSKSYIKINNSLWWTPYVTMIRNFSVVGSPTVAGATVSNFSASNRLKTSLNIPSNFTNLRMLFRVKYATGNGNQLVMWPIRTINNKCGLWDTVGRVGTETLTDGAEYWIKIDSTQTEARVYHRACVAGETREQAEAATDWTYDSTSVNVPAILPSGTKTRVIGTNDSSEYYSEYWKGHIYLKDSLVRADGVVVWSPLDTTKASIKVLNTTDNFENVTAGQTLGYKNDLHMNSEEEIVGCKTGTTPEGEIGDTVISTTRLFLDQNKEAIRNEKIGLSVSRASDTFHYVKVGNPTVSYEGLASNFSTSDYLVCGEIPYDDLSTIQTKFKLTASSSNKRYIIGTTIIDKTSEAGLKSGIYVGVNSNNHLVLNNSDGASWETEAEGTTELQLNTWYYIKITKSSSDLALTLSSTGESYTTEATLATTKSSINLFTIGAPLGGREEAFVDGVVDLTGTTSSITGFLRTVGYYRIDAGSGYSDETQGYVVNNSILLKYLQDVIVSSESYLNNTAYGSLNCIGSTLTSPSKTTTSTFAPNDTSFILGSVDMPSSYNTFDMLFKVTFRSYPTYQVGASADILTQHEPQFFKISNGTTLTCYNKTEGDLASSATLTTNKQYWIRCYSDGTTYTVSYKLFVTNETETNVDFNNFTVAATSSHPEYMIPSSPFILYLGRNGDSAYSSQYWGGRIYLSNNYIKVNGERIWSIFDNTIPKAAYLQLIKPSESTTDLKLSRAVTATAASMDSVCTPVYLSVWSIIDGTYSKIIM